MTATFEEARAAAAPALMGHHNAVTQEWAKVERRVEKNEELLKAAVLEQQAAEKELQELRARMQENKEATEQQKAVVAQIQERAAEASKAVREADAKLQDSKTELHRAQAELRGLFETFDTDQSVSELKQQISAAEGRQQAAVDRQNEARAALQAQDQKAENARQEQNAKKTQVMQQKKTVARLKRQIKSNKRKTGFSEWRLRRNQGRVGKQSGGWLYNIGAGAATFAGACFCYTPIYLIPSVAIPLACIAAAGLLVMGVQRVYNFFYSIYREGCLIPSLERRVNDLHNEAPKLEAALQQAQMDLVGMEQAYANAAQNYTVESAEKTRREGEVVAAEADVTQMAEALGTLAGQLAQTENHVQSRKAELDVHEAECVRRVAADEAKLRGAEAASQDAQRQQLVEEGRLLVQQEELADVFNAAIECKAELVDLESQVRMCTSLVKGAKELRENVAKHKDKAGQMLNQARQSLANESTAAQAVDKFQKDVAQYEKDVNALEEKERERVAQLQKAQHLLEHQQQKQVEQVQQQPQYARK